ncbi:hypothetical protein LOD69_10880, partial [Xylella fastidiosa subsp. multiplex]
KYQIHTTGFHGINANRDHWLAERGARQVVRLKQPPRPAPGIERNRKTTSIRDQKVPPIAHPIPAPVQLATATPAEVSPASRLTS